MKSDQYETADAFGRLATVKHEFSRRHLSAKHATSGLVATRECHALILRIGFPLKGSIRLTMVALVQQLPLA